MNAARERILVVDDEENVVVLFKRILEKEGYEVESAASGEEALGWLETDWFDLLISDLKMPRMDGLEFIQKAKTLRPSVPCIVLTAYGTIESAVAAMKKGAYDYLAKPANIEEIKLVVKKALDLHRLTREVERLRAQVEIGREFSEIVGRSRPMRALFRLIKLVARSNATVLIQGESGTGKELIARAIHQHSPRHDRPFVAIDCGALPETLLESELFGHMRGAFTGAISTKKGLFEEAHGGTLLLDEIGNTTPAFQSKLLRVLQESEIRPVGGNKSIKVDVRVIAATNKDLKGQMEKRTFREDLYYRLAVVPVVIPPLKDRTEDIPLLADQFIKKYCKQNGLEPKRISAQRLKDLIDYTWPGNVRELENVIERAVLLSPGPEINSEALFPEPVAAEKFHEPLQQATRVAIENVEREKIIKATKIAKGNRSLAAKYLGISRAALYNKLKRYQLTH
ncbi:MAG: sigma-54-dependent Fis family transcriptional regulator [Deltaproteobacteria bacterium]|nr:sigma-54-dependent Fis family transcriptional regulator [Deltaproteobacteria bacterium]